MRNNATIQLQQYGGLLVWEEYTEVYSGGWRPQMQIPLYIKDFPIPFRNRKNQEVYTRPSQEHITGTETTTKMLFEGAPDILQVQFTGFILTPWDGSTWQLYIDGRATLGGLTPIYSGFTYGEAVEMYVNGQMNRQVTGRPKRRDPDYFVAPYGQKYINPVIASWDTAFTVNPRKQTFSCALYLER